MTRARCDLWMMAIKQSHSFTVIQYSLRVRLFVRIFFGKISKEKENETYVLVLRVRLG